MKFTTLKDFTEKEILYLKEKLVPIDKPYAYHKPSADGHARITKLREKFSEVEALINEVCPNSRHKSVAITNLETTAMWAIKAVVFNDPDSEIEQSTDIKS